MLPRDFYKAVDDARPVCAMFQRGHCKKGGSCQKRHERGQSLSYKLPHISRHKDADGNPTIVLRPPLKDALKAKFEAEGVIPTIGAGRRIEGTPYMVFEVENMNLPNRKACSQALHQEFVVEITKDDKMKKHYKSDTEKVTYPEYIGHGTSIEASFKIQKTGKINNSGGIAGPAVYGFDCKARMLMALLGFYSVAESNSRILFGGILDIRQSLGGIVSNYSNFIRWHLLYSNFIRWH